MCMINWSDENAIFLILSCLHCCVCVCALKDLCLKGRLGLHPAVKMPLSTSVSYTQCVSVYTSSGIWLSAIWVSFPAHKCTDKNLSAFLLSPLCMFSLGSREAKMRPLHSALADSELLYPRLACRVFNFMSLHFKSLLLSQGRLKKCLSRNANELCSTHRLYNGLSEL